MRWTVRSLKRYARQLLDAKNMKRASSRSFALLEPVRVASLPPIRDVIAISIVRNEMLRLPDFFRHHRNLGIARFVIVDTGSTDGTADYLAEQPDVDLWRATEPYTANLQVLWTNALTQHMGAGRWYLAVDADEQLVYDGCDRHDVIDLTSFLDRNNLAALPCLMLDMYGAGPVKNHVPGPSDRLVDVCPYFDGEGYRFDLIKRGKASCRIITDEGGARRRLFSVPGDPFESALSKTPLAKRGAMAVSMTSHRMFPPRFNHARVNGCLLHFKFLCDFHSRAIEAVELEQHWQQSLEYKRYLRVVEARPDMSIVFSGTKRFRGAESLIEAGLMTRLWMIDSMSEACA